MYTNSRVLRLYPAYEEGGYLGRDVHLRLNGVYKVLPTIYMKCLGSSPNLGTLVPRRKTKGKK